MTDRQTDWLTDRQRETDRQTERGNGTETWTKTETEPVWALDETAVYENNITINSGAV